MSKRKPTDQRWINTFVEFAWNAQTQQYESIKCEGYWYAGPLSLATTPPTMEVTNWAFYNDGTESGSAIIGSVNTNPSLEPDTIYLVRFGIEETSGNASKNEAPQLQYNHNAGGWNNVTGSSSVVQSTATSNITDGADTTQRITAFTFDSTNQGFDEVDGIAGGGTADLNNTGFEALFAFQIISTDVANNDTIVLKIVDSNAADADYDVYNQTDPTITVNESTDVSAGITTNLATSAVGSMAAAITIALTGVLSTGSVGNVGVSTDYQRAITGVQSTSAVGSVTQSRTVALTGVSGTSAVGSVSPGGDVIEAITGVSSTSAVGSVGVTKSGSAPLTGNAATSAVGTVTASASASQPITGTVSTSAVGSVSPQTAKALTGNAGTSAVGSVTASSGATKAITGVQATSAVGSVGITESGQVSITGVESTAAVGTVSFTKSGSLPITGVSASSAVGTITASAGTSQALTGLEITGSSGSVGPSISLSLSGVAATSELGSVIVSTPGVAALTGVLSTASAGDVVAFIPSAIIPANRVYSISEDDRIKPVAEDNRIKSVSAEDRVSAVTQEDRS